MVKQQQRRTDRCFLPVGSNNVTLVRFPTQRRPQASHDPQLHQATVRENAGDDEEPGAKRICLSGSDDTLTNRDAAPESCDQTGSETSSSEERVSAADVVQQEALQDSEDDRAAQLASAGGLKVTIQRRGESREFGEKTSSSERLTCHVCHCTCPSAQSFVLHMSGAEHQRRLQRITQSVSQHSGRRCGAPELWCDVCQTNFTGDVILHRRTKQHKESKKSCRPFCCVCRRHFRTPRKFVEHMKSPEHKRQVQLDKSQEEEMITVDAVGCFESEPTEGDEETRSQERPGGDEETRSEERPGGDEETRSEERPGGDEETRSQERREEGLDQDLPGTEENTEGDEKTRSEERSEGDEEALRGEKTGRTELEREKRDEDAGKERKRGESVSEQEERRRGDEDVGDAAEGLDAEDVSEAEATLTQADAESNSHTVHGSSHIVPVSGFFCRLCRKFFFRETSARDLHCSTEQHLSRVKQEALFTHETCHTAGKEPPPD